MDSSEFYQGMYDLRAGLTWALKALPLSEKQYAADSNYANNLRTIASIYYRLGMMDSALKYEEKDLDISQKIFNGAHIDLAQGLNIMAHIQNGLGKYSEAEKYFLEALDTYRKLYNGDDNNIAFSLTNVGGFYYGLSKYDKACQYYNEALEMRRRLFKNDEPDLALSIQNLAIIYDVTSKYEISDSLYNEALDMYERLYKGDHQEIANVLNNMAISYQDRGRYAESEKYYLKSLGIYSSLYPGDNPSKAGTLTSLGSLYFYTGRYNEAEKYFKESVSMYRRLYNYDHLHLANSINNLAQLYKNIGNYAEAEKLHTESLNIRKRVHKEDHVELAMTISDVAAFYQRIGNINKAESLHGEALAMIRRIVNKDNYYLAMILNNTAQFYYSIGKYDIAEPLYKESLGMFKRIYKDDNPNIALLINNLAAMYGLAGRYDEAEPLYKEAMEMRRRIFKTDHNKVATSLNNIAFFYEKTGKDSLAEKYYVECVEMYQRLGEQNNPEFSICQQNLADLYFHRGSYEKAAPLYEQAYRNNMRIIHDYFPYMSEKDKTDFWGTYEPKISGYLLFGANYSRINPEITQKMADINLSTKGIVFNSVQKALSHSRQVERTLEEWRNSRQLWLNLVQNPQKAKRMGIDIDSIGKVASELETEISKQSPAFKKAFDTTKITWKDVQNSLNDNEAAIEIIRTPGLVDTVTYLALIINKNCKEPELVVLNNGREFEENGIKKYTDLVRYQQFHKRLNDMDYIELESLYNNLWKPIWDRLKGVYRIFISLDGVYNQLNLNTLLNPSNGKYVIDEVDLRIVTSTRELAEKNNDYQDLKSISKNNRGILSPKDFKASLFGDPQFVIKKETGLAGIDKKELSNATRNYYLGGLLDQIAAAGLKPLPGTKIEIKKISADFQKMNIKPDEFLGDAALEENVKSAKNPRIMHVATHGVFLKDLEYISTGMLDEETKKSLENPLLRSMLLFAGAENTIRGENSDDLIRDDGILTAYEVMNLDLDNTDLVVLSACETGLGEVKNGEGVYGLQRAFQVAGAKSIIMSLWSVNDEATQELMTDFYSHWLGGLPKREAFRTAQLHLKQKYPGFYYWGAFVMVGE